MRLGYFGGSFDPPHLGHLAVAQAAADTFALDRVLFVPTSNQPLKPAGALAPYADRLAMVTMLCQSDPRFVVSDLEAPDPRGTPNYTIDTLTRLHGDQPEATIFVIVGADAFLTLPQWRCPEELLAVADWIVVARAQVLNATTGQLRLPPLSLQQRGRVHVLATVDHPASATAIRSALAAGDDCSGMLPPEVLAYIRAKHLYE